MEMRVIKKSDALLCPASLGDEEHIAYIEVLSTVGTRGYEQFFYRCRYGMDRSQWGPPLAKAVGVPEPAKI